ncbi:hypothetical protein IFO69_13745 [Echinicola sp. CAU 1574]|uniref:TolB-like 6-blade propeller-like n=1 Tax=Echinicola arenosa TaxID=2774144 RepID=A0ABR9ANC9_9BACT|nr:BF3164 family lipoprotein [Echinicola arenosa]MBD8489816.1 hypothetical protein [Echinicola arenosa]
MIKQLDLCGISMVLVILLISCESEKSVDKYHKHFTEEDITEKVFLESKKYYFEELKRPMRIHLIGDHLIVGEHTRIDIGYPPLHIINTRNWQYEMSKGVRGLGPGEISSAFILDDGFEENSFWVYSGRSKRFSEFYTNDSIKLSHHQIKQDGNFYMAISMIWASDSTLMCRMANDKNRFVEFNINGERVNEFGEWRTMPLAKRLNNYMMADFYKGWLKGNKQKGVYVLACFRKDQLEILNRNSGETIFVEGPEQNIPKFKIINNGKGGQKIIINSDEPHRYRDVFVGDKYIYGLYCGRTNKEINSTGLNATEVFVFDFEGNILRSLSLDRSIQNLVVDEKEHKLYGTTTDEDPGIAVFELP